MVKQQSRSRNAQKPANSRRRPQVGDGGSSSMNILNMDDQHDQCVEHLPAICCVDSEGFAKSVMGKGYVLDLKEKCRILGAGRNSILNLVDDERDGGGDDGSQGFGLLRCDGDSMLAKLVDTDLNKTESTVEISSIDCGDYCLVEDEFHLHVRSRHLLYYRKDDKDAVFREFVPNSLVLWNNPWPDYNPPCFQLPKPSSGAYVDGEIDRLEDSAWFGFNADNLIPERGLIDRKSVMGLYLLDEKGRPTNPMGRTGLCGRGLLNLWGPNHIRQYLITRPVPNGGGGAYEFVGVFSSVLNRWIFPETNAFEDTGIVPDKVYCRFAMELVSRRASGILKTTKSAVDETFRSKSTNVFYTGYLDDSRNTDNAWIESVAMNVDDDAGNVLAEFDLDDPAEVTGFTVSWLKHDEQRLHDSCKDLLVAFESSRCVKRQEVPPLPSSNKCCLISQEPESQ